MLIRGPAQSLPGVVEALRFATSSRHASLAKSPPMVRLFAADYTLSEYRNHLGCLLGLFEPLERAAARVAGGSPSLSGPQRSKDLRDDLSAMGSSVNEIESFRRCPYVPSLPAAGLRGYLYVMLGSMLGGEIIVRRLRSVFGGDASYRFYGGTEPQNYRSHWTSFCSDIEEHGKEDVQTICVTAMQVFDLYATWLSARPGELGVSTEKPR